MTYGIMPEDGVKKLRVSCQTLRSIISEAFIRENKDANEGYRLHAGIAHWVRVPVCECHTCESLLADSRRAGRKKHPSDDPTPVINCMTAIRLKEKAANSDVEEEDRLLDIVDEALVVHQCGNPSVCRFRGFWENDRINDEAVKAMERYREFQMYRPKARMEVNTYSGSTYTLHYRDGKPWVHRKPFEGAEADEELVGLYRMGNRLIINDWFTSSVVGSRMVFAIKPDRDKERELGLIEEMHQHIDEVQQRLGEDQPPWQLVLDDIEKSLDKVEEALA